MRIKWTFEMLKEEAKKYKTRGEFNTKSKGAYLSAYRKGILDQICAHMDPSINAPYTLDELQIEALKYTTRWEFQKKSHGEYQAAYRRGLLDKICGHMVEVNHMWADEELKIEALKYKNRVEFQIKSSGAYQSARDRGILEEICSHMKRSLTISAQEELLFSLIKEQYPEANTFRDRNVIIEGKPYIKGFDIDMLVGNKGIEFDGTYWHSFEGLQRSRKHWPKEDLVNYHRIKDSHFLSIGIQILHIKEEDWSLNSKDCFDKCLQFLGDI